MDGDSPRPGQVTDCHVSNAFVVIRSRSAVPTIIDALRDTAKLTHALGHTRGCPPTGQVVSGSSGHDSHVVLRQYPCASSATRSVAAASRPWSRRLTSEP